MAKIARPDIHQASTLLTKKVKEPNDTGWKKLVRMLKHLNRTKKKYLTLSADDLKLIN